MSIERVCPDCGSDHSIVEDALTALDHLKPASEEENEKLRAIRDCIRQQADK
jgi:hypothetical protein